MADETPEREEEETPYEEWMDLSEGVGEPGAAEELDPIKPKVDFCITCDAVAQGPDGKKTLYGIFQNLHFPSFPARLPSCAVVIRLSGGAGKHGLSVKIFDPDKNVIFSPPKPMDIELVNPLIAAEIVISLQGMLFPRDGLYWIRIYLNDEKEEQDYPIRVGKIVSPTP